MTGYAAAQQVDAANDFMARDDRIADAGKFRIDDMEVGAANPTRVDFDADLPVARDWIVALLHLEECGWSREHHRAHGMPPNKAGGAVRPISLKRNAGIHCSAIASPV
jgi:hypothetical protein